MIVALPRKQVVESPWQQIVKPIPIIKVTKYTVDPDSIASNIKARQTTNPLSTKVATTTNESIAERLLRCKRAEQPEQAYPVLDLETGQLLEYRQLLRHPKFKDDWNILAANEFGRLVQGIKGKVNATDTIKFICKSDIPVDRLKDVKSEQIGKTKPYPLSR